MSREVIGLVWATSIAISLLNCTSEVNYFWFSILVPWCKSHVVYIYSISKHSFFM